MKTRILWLLVAASLVAGAISGRCEVYADWVTVTNAADNARTNTWADPVVAIGVTNDGSWWRIGSGVIVDRRFVVFAAHQLWYRTQYSGMRVTLRFGTNTLAQVQADWWTNHPGYTAGMPAGRGVDLAILHLRADITNVAPATMFTGTLPAQGLMCMAGFGMPGTASQTPTNYDGIKRAGANWVGDTFCPYADSQYLVCEFTPPGFSNWQPLEWQLSDFDSGGGWFVNVGGQYQLAGISCFSSNPRFVFGTQSGALNLSLYTDWVRQVIQSFTPMLTLRKVDSTTVQLSWPSVATNFVLQTSSDLTATNWVPIPTPPSDDGTNRFLLLTNTAPCQFYRLTR